MKPVPSGFINFIKTNQRMLLGELYTFTLQSGAQDFFTNLDVSVIYGGNIFKGNALRIEGLKYKVAVGWQVDEQEILISAFPGETLAGASFFTALESGLLDGAYFTRQRVFWAANDGRPWIDYQALPVTVVTLFIGRVSTVDKIGRTQAQIKVKSPLSLLDIDMPRNTYEPGCQWSLFDAGCTLDRNSFSLGYTVQSATALSITPTIPIAPSIGADGIPVYAFGRIKFVSGVNNNLIASIATNDGTSFQLSFPLTEIPVLGDTFIVSQGCAKTGRGGACELKFANLANFRGFPRIPPISLSV